MLTETSNGSRTNGPKGPPEVSGSQQCTGSPMGRPAVGTHTHMLPASWALQPLPLRLLGRQDLDADKVKGTSGALRGPDNRHETTCTAAAANAHPSSPRKTNLHRVQAITDTLYQQGQGLAHHAATVQPSPCPAPSKPLRGRGCLAQAVTLGCWARATFLGGQL